MLVMLLIIGLVGELAVIPLIRNLEGRLEGFAGTIERGPAQKVLGAKVLANLGKIKRQSRQVGRFVVTALGLGCDGLERGGVNWIAEADAIHLDVGVAGGVDDVLERLRAGRVVAIGTKDNGMFLIRVVRPQRLDRREQGVPAARAGGKILDVVGPDAGNVVVQQRFVRGERLHLVRGLVVAVKFIDAELGGVGLLVDHFLGGAHLGVHPDGNPVAVEGAVWVGNALAEVQHQIGFEDFGGDALADALQDDRGFVGADGHAIF